MLRSSLVSLICLVILLCSTASAAEKNPADRRAGAVEERLLVRWVHRPVFIEPTRRGSPERCSRLRPSDIEITEDGDPVRVTAVDATMPGTIHAIVIDTSYSMRTTKGAYPKTRLERAREAAIRYVEGLPEGEMALVASFDDNLLLRSAASSDREALVKAIRELDYGHDTALWDALYYTCRYLEPYTQQKVVVLLTDGEDSASLQERTTRQILDLASTRSNLTFFPIGVGLPKGKSPRQELARSILAGLAQGTGGTFYEVDHVDQLERAFENVQKRLEGKHLVSYIPRPFGEGSLDEPSIRDFRWRQVRVRSRKGVPCRIIPLAAPQRLEGRLELAAASWFELPAGSPAATEPPSLPSCFPLPERWSAGSRISFKAPTTWGAFDDGDLDLYPIEPLRAMVGQTLDIALERSVLYDHGRMLRKGKLRIQNDRNPLLSRREFAVEVPPFVEVVRRLVTPEDVLIRLLEREACPAGVEGEPFFFAEPQWVHGQTFLEIREALGWAMFRYFPDYRDWTIARIREDLEPEMETLLREYRQSRALTPEETRRARRTLARMAEHPSHSQPQRYLAEWLGDVPAREIALRLERRAANVLLRDPSHRDGLPTLLMERWGRLVRWLPPPTQVRILTPLVPAYDPDRDVIGYYRILLPKANLHGSLEQPVPEAPRALRTLLWLLDRPGVANLLAGRVRVRALDHRQASRSAIRRMAGPKMTRVVDLSLESASGEGGEVLLSAYFPRQDEPDPPGARSVPACMSVLHRDDPPEELQGIVRELLERISDETRTCPPLDI